MEPLTKYCCFPTKCLCSQRSQASTWVDGVRSLNDGLRKRTEGLHNSNRVPLDDDEGAGASCAGGDICGCTDGDGDGDGDGTMPLDASTGYTTTSGFCNKTVNMNLIGSVLVNVPMVLMQHTGCWRALCQ
eukprot:14089405-Alexandrium_andersonii.AAC.1